MFKGTVDVFNMFKGTVDVISSDDVPTKELNVCLTTNTAMEIYQFWNVKMDISLMLTQTNIVNRTFNSIKG